MKFPDRVFFIDTETGGLKDNQHSILTIGVCLLNLHNGEIEDNFSVSVKGGDGTYHVTAEALNINKINLIEHDKTATPSSEALDLFIAWLNKYRTSPRDKLTAGGQNPNFDVGFLENQLGFEWGRYFHYRILNTQNIAYFLSLLGVLPLKGTGLDHIIKALGIHVPNRHTALGDAIATAQCYWKMFVLLRSNLPDIIDYSAIGGKFNGEL